MKLNKIQTNQLFNKKELRYAFFNHNEGMEPLEDLCYVICSDYTRKEKLGDVGEGLGGRSSNYDKCR